MMDTTDVTTLVREIEQRIPGVRTRIDTTESEVAFIDVTNDKHGVTIEWRPGSRIGVTSLPTDGPAGPYELCDSVATLVDRVEELLCTGQRTAAPGPTWPADLTKREVEIAELLACAFTTAEIAVKLGISIKTVDTHRGHLLNKMSLRDEGSLIRYALRERLVSGAKDADSPGCTQRRRFPRKRQGAR